MRSNASPNRFSWSYPLDLPAFACAKATAGARPKPTTTAAANLNICQDLHKGGCTVAEPRADAIRPLSEVLLPEAWRRLVGAVSRDDAWQGHRLTTSNSDRTRFFSPMII